MKRSNQIVAFFLVFIILLTPATAFAEKEPQISARGAIVMDYDTGQVLYEKNGDKAFSAASMTKVMAPI